jgi:hypothetical protein
MTEREFYPYERLHPQLVELISQIEDQTGREVQIQANRAIRDRARAVYVVSDPDPTRHLILYDPKYEGHLDHLVAHECGHIVRFTSASPEEQTVAKTTSASRGRAAERMLPDLRRLVNSGLPEGALADLLPIWLGGTITQIADTPSDIHIERWIRERTTALRDIQEASLLNQIKANAASMRPVVAAFTPRPVWTASNAMNYVSAKAYARLLDRPDLVRPYRSTAIEKLGEELFEMFNKAPGGSLATDRQVSDRWAERLGLSDWFEWTTLDEVSPEVRRAWE